MVPQEQPPWHHISKFIGKPQRVINFAYILIAQTPPPPLYSTVRNLKTPPSPLVAYVLNECPLITAHQDGDPDWKESWWPQDMNDSAKEISSTAMGCPRNIPLIHCPSKILNRLSKTMHSAASLRKKGKTLSLPLHAHSKHMGRRKVLLGQGIF